MVTKVDYREVVNEVLTHPLVRLKMVAGELDIPIVIRPWWGSRRALNRRIHTGCGGDVFVWDDIGQARCRKCFKDIPVTATEIEQVPHTWEHPGVKYPEVQGGVVVFWEGSCACKRHNHRQTLEVKAVGPTAFLVRITAGLAGTNILVGVDDDHPFGTPVARRISTVEEAFEWLVPKRARDAREAGLDVKRQGDWFFIPIDREPLQDDEPSHTRYDRVWGSRPLLYVRELYQWAPLLYNRTQTRHRGEQVVYHSCLGCNGEVPRVRGEVTAPDHPSVQLDTWHLGLRRRTLPGAGGMLSGED